MTAGECKSGESEKRGNRCGCSCPGKSSANKSNVVDSINLYKGISAPLHINGLKFLASGVRKVLMFIKVYVICLYVEESHLSLMSNSIERSDDFFQKIFADAGSSINIKMRIYAIKDTEASRLKKGFKSNMNKYIEANHIDQAILKSDMDKFLTDISAKDLAPGEYLDFDLIQGSTLNISRNISFSSSYSNKSLIRAILSPYLTSHSPVCSELVENISKYFSCVL